ncbi:dihydrofolate reductase family protein [Paenibacillus sp. sgz500992]|uniref:dihydrofolate reductase family protein n=1 Tax=Paenibacillus sp. sgz500992 TaxID=3242476 RepID=UPI0036D38B7E
MRNLIVSEFLTVDGVMEDPQWTFQYSSDEQDQFKFAELKAADALLLGRVTYEGFAAAWPNMLEQTGEYGEMMNGYAKHVVSTTLTEAGWNNSSLIKNNLVEEITKLKEQPGRDILVFGSCTLVQSLISLGLVDEYRLMVFPVVLGKGKRLFGDGLEKQGFELVQTKRFSSGVAVVCYRPAKD